MNKFGIDQEALIQKFSEATAKQGESLRKAVTEATLKALRSRELSLTNIRQVLETVAKAASAGAASSALPTIDVASLLAKAVAGMDSALSQAVQAHQRALQQLLDQGADLRETQVKKAIADVEKMEEALFAAMRKAASASAGAQQGPWAEVLKATQGKGTSTGTQANAMIEKLMQSAQENLREGRAIGMRASQALLDSYATLVSGVLIGMSDALGQGGATAAAAAPARRK